MNFKAFCPELNRFVSGEEVWGLRYGKQRINQDLTFQCPDQECTARFIMRNCAVYLNAWESSFRLYPRSEHRAGCSFVEFTRQQKNMQVRVKNRRRLKAIRYKN